MSSAILVVLSGRIRKQHARVHSGMRQILLTTKTVKMILMMKRKMRSFMKLILMTIYEAINATLCIFSLYLCTIYVYDFMYCKCQIILMLSNDLGCSAMIW